MDFDNGERRRAKCPVCQRLASVQSSGPFFLKVQCAACGRFVIEESLPDYFQTLQDRRLIPYLSAHLRQATDRGEDVTLLPESWRALAEGHAATPVSQKLRKLLDYISRHTNIGEWLYIPQEEIVAAAADMKDTDELKFVLDHLKELKQIDYGPMPPPPDRRAQDG